MKQKAYLQRVHGPPYNTTSLSFTVEADDALTGAKAQLAAIDLMDDYDYERHLMPITGSGAFISRDG